MTERIRRRATVTVEDFSRLVADIYAAAAAPSSGTRPSATFSARLARQAVRC